MYKSRDAFGILNAIQAIAMQSMARDGARETVIGMFVGELVYDCCHAGLLSVQRKNLATEEFLRSSPGRERRRRPSAVGQRHLNILSTQRTLRQTESERLVEQRQQQNAAVL